MPKMPSIPKELNSLFPAAWLRRTARQYGAVLRQRKVDIVYFFWILMMVNQTGAYSSMAALQRYFRVTSKIKIARSAFLKRFSSAFVAFLNACLLHAMGATIEPMATPALFSSFQDVWAQDSTLVTLAEALKAIFPGPRNNNAPAAAKVNAVYSVLSGKLKRVVIAEGTKAETKFLKLNREIKGILLLLDLGYFSYAAMSRIDYHEGYVISRMKKSCNPRIVQDNYRGPGRKRDLVGMKLKDAIKGLGRSELDVWVEAVFYQKKRVKEGGKRKTKNVQCRRRFRVVGVRHPESGELHLYITNIGLELMTPTQIRAAYSARWTIELVMRELKSNCQMRSFPSEKSEVIQALILCSMLRLMVSRVVLDNLRQRIVWECRQQYGDGDFADFMERMLVNRTGYLRFAEAWNCFSLLYLPDLFREAGLDWDMSDLDLMLLAAAFDPNTQRNSLFQRLTEA
jgi:putative transposase